MSQGLQVSLQLVEVDFVGSVKTLKKKNIVLLKHLLEFGLGDTELWAIGAAVAGSWGWVQIQRGLCDKFWFRWAQESSGC
jgi:hypothetical protein